MLYLLNNFKYLELKTFNIPNEIQIKLENYCNLKFSRYLPKLNITEKNYLLVYLQSILYYLYKNINIEENNSLDIFLKQISMNNDRNLLAIINLIFPYLDNKNDYFNQKNITSFKHLVENKNNDNDKPIFCNYIYDHNTIPNISFTQKNKYNTLKYKSVNKLFHSDEIDDISALYYRSVLYLIYDIINKIRYKFYINWINTFPLTLNNYKSRKLYKNSFKLIDDEYYYNDKYKNLNFPIYFDEFYNEVDIKMIKEVTGENEKTILSLIIDSSSSMLEYVGINLEDIYNTLVNDYYLSIKRNKWLLFEFIDNNNIYLIIQILNKILNIDNIIKNKQWFTLNNQIQNNFSLNWDKFKKAIKNKQSLLNFNYNILKNVFVSFVSYFELHYNGLDDLIAENKYEKLIINIDDNNDEMLEISINDIITVKKSELSIDNYYKSIEKVPNEDIYTFLFNEINAIKNTPYNDMLFNDNKLNDIYKKINLDDKDNYILTPKNYYNFAKSLLFKNYLNSPYNDPKSLLFPNLWDSISIEEKYIIILRLNKIGSEQKWFNISGVLKKLYGDINVKEHIELIYSKIRSKLIDLTFENLIKKGCICFFEYNPELSDKLILTSDYNIKKNRLIENMKKKLTKEKILEYQEGYYFINNKQYKNVKINTKKKSINFIEFISEMYSLGDSWNTFYAVDWISQIDFYLKFINQRVMYITGATGQGKSTQVPKLYLYGIKSLLYKNNGKILCTAPRIDPVLKNTETISSSMGIPIKSYNKLFKSEERTLNSNIQYKYAANDHVSNNSNYYLRILTDGIIIKMLENSPILKEPISKNQKKPLFTKNNLADIIMIDEAHEHNVNMDIILTKMKHVLLYNNDIKLSIISATMEDDESIFRRFYRCIDDNLCFPINTFKLFFGIDKNYLDRRYHISPPGETTQFKVTEYYDNGSLDTFKYNTGESIKKVVEIFNKTTKGDILLFSTTVKELNNLVNTINKLIPFNCIALPYHGQLKEEYKQITKDSDYNKLEIDKSDIVDVFSGLIKIEDAKKVKKNSYNRACFIATNAAEASLTIKTLKFIVDIGFELSVAYDYDIQSTKIEIVKITEASRIQRRGRVGRVSSGTVYYMYPEKSRENIIAKYKISTQEFSNYFTNLLTIENIKIIDRNIIEKLLTLKKLENKEINQIKVNSCADIIYNQYKILSNFYDEKNECKFIDYNYHITNHPGFYDFNFPTYTDGYDIKQLLDVSGHFYIINPLEIKIKRDHVTGNIIDLNDNIIEIPSSEINKIFKIGELSGNLIKFDDTNIYGSIKLKELNKIQSKLNSYDDIYSNIISYSLLFDNSNDYKLLLCILFIYNLLKNIEYDLNKLFKKKLKKLKKVNNTELTFFHNIFYNILNSSITNLNSFEENMKKKNSDLTNKLLNYFENNEIDESNISKFCKINNYNKEKYNEIINLVLKGSFDSYQIDDDKDIDNTTIKDSINNNILNQYSNLNNLNYDIISKSLVESLNKYLYIKNKLLSNTKKNASFYDSLDNLKEIININMPYNEIQKIKTIFLTCYLNNICYNYNNKTYSIYSSKLLKKNLNIINDLSQIIFYLNSNLNDEISILSNITKNDLLNVAPLSIKFIPSKVQKLVGINYKDIKNNLHLITKNNTNFYDNKGVKINVDNKEYEDKNFSNILMSQIISNPSILNQSGGYPYSSNFLFKVKIESFKKFKKLPDLVDKSIDINKFSYVYLNYVNFKLCGLFLVQKRMDQLVYVVSILDTCRSFPYIIRKLQSKGNTVIYRKN